jgi:uncharacterized membrane protein YeiH
MLAVLASVGTFVLAKRWRVLNNVLVHADAVGLAVFTVIGFQKGLAATGLYSIAVVMGVMTAVVGGIFRDVLSSEVPLVLQREVYASASLAGGIVLALFAHSELPNPFGVAAAILMTLLIRLVAISWELGLPVFLTDKGDI